MKNLIIIIAVLFTTGLFAQNNTVAKPDSSIQPLSIPVQFAVEDTTNKKEYTIILAQITETEYIFQYSPDWNINKAEVNRKFAAYKPLVQTYELVSPGTWKFTIIEGLLDSNEIFRDFVYAITDPYLDAIKPGFNRKAPVKKN